MEQNELIGWIGSACMAICSLPQAYKSIRDKNSRGVSIGMIILWFLGELFTFIYVLPIRDYPLLTNYAINFILMGIIGWYWIFPQSSAKN